MDAIQAYKIGFSGLSNGYHTFSMDIDQAFFDVFEQSEIREGHVNLSLGLEKGENMLVLDFAFKGWIGLDCDLCLEAFRQEVDFAQRLFVKFGEDYTEQSEDVVIIPFGESHLDIAQYVYEYLHLIVPIRKIHPDKTGGLSGCDPDMLDKYQEYLAASKKGAVDQAVTGSAWDALKKLKFNTEE